VGHPPVVVPEHAQCPPIQRNSSLLQLCLFLMVLFIQTCTRPHNTHCAHPLCKICPFCNYAYSSWSSSFKPVLTQTIHTVPTHSAKFVPSAIMPIPHGPLHSNLYSPTQYTLAHPLREICPFCNYAYSSWCFSFKPAFTHLQQCQSVHSAHPLRVCPPCSTQATT